MQVSRAFILQNVMINCLIENAFEHWISIKTFLDGAIVFDGDKRNYFQSHLIIVVLQIEID